MIRQLTASVPEDAVATAVTRDTLLRGRVVVYQPARGYRFSLDPVLLSGFIAPPYGHFLDLGAGSGILGFVMLDRDRAARGTSVEIQPRLAALAARSASENGFDQRLVLVESDFLAWARQQATESFDLVATNPPFYEVDRGHISPNPQRALAHHELALPLPEWTAAAAGLLRPTGRLAVVFPCERQDALLAALERQGFGDVRLRLARPAMDRPHHRVLVEARRGAARIQMESDLVVHVGADFSPEVKSYLGEGKNPP